MPRPRNVLIISACLLGRACRYDGKTKAVAWVQKAAGRWTEAGGEVVPVCPEEAGGLPTPRPPADLRGGDGHQVLAGLARVQRCEDDGDVTAQFVLGARRSAARLDDSVVALLKARSPSCGVGETQIDGGPAEGDGVFAALVRQHGIPLSTDEDPQPEILRNP